jgi:phospholipid-translocating ATPase
VKSIKKYTDKRTCAIGDGGNDVAMIQEADVGIGLVGKEGLQASLASDFSITKFSNLSFLLLWYGRISYTNTATMAKFVIHRGLLISLVQVSIFNTSLSFP